jgi:hypothetical protein
LTFGYSVYRDYGKGELTYGLLVAAAAFENRMGFLEEDEADAACPGVERSWRNESCQWWSESDVGVSSSL